MPEDRRRDVTGRALDARGLDLSRFFAPRRVAFVGASDREGGQAALNVRLFLDWAEPRGVEVMPVNPHRDEVAGRPCYPALTEVPGDVDLVIVMVPAVAAEGVLREAAKIGAPFAVLFSSGFAESGDEGTARQYRIEELLTTSDLRVLGPNTTLNSFQEFRAGATGERIGLITQSGHQGRPIYQAQQIGVGLAGWAPTGNEVDLESADFVRHFVDTGADVIAAYIEGFKDGRSLLLAADHAAQAGVPIVVVKVGRTDLGSSWATSHSGHLAGSDRVTDAAFRQAGIVRVDALDELLDVSMLLARAGVPVSDGVAIYSISGGTGAHLADLATARGLDLPSLSDATQRRLHAHIADDLRVSNPVDSGGMPSMDEQAGRAIIDAILDDPSVGVLVVPMPGSFSPLGEIMSRHLVDAARDSDKPICVVWGSPVGDEEAYREVLLPSGVPVFRTVGNALTAVVAWLDHHRFQARYASAFADAITDASPVREQVRPLLAGSDARHSFGEPGLHRPPDGGHTLSEAASKRVVAAYGVPVTRDVLCTSAVEARAAFAELGGPVVVKACSATITHKSDLGLVRIGLADADAVATATDEVLAAARRHAPDDIDGVLVCEQAPADGVETIVGIVHDELFGPVVLFGIGGIAVEVYDDVAFRVPPFTRDEAARMIREVRGLALLDGARGHPPADLDALADVIMAVQRLAVELHDQVVELDVNPLLALPDGCLALDALVVAAAPT